jgi:hypothetical protein
VLGVAVGTAFLISPSHYFAPGSAWRRWFLETDVGDIFNRRYAVERTIYRRHRIFGGFVIAGAVAGLALLVFLWSHPQAAQWLRDGLGRLGLRLTLALTGTVFTLLVLTGFLMLFRPSLLKGVEVRANRWIEAKRPPKRAEITGLILRGPRLLGVLLMLAGAKCLAVFLF